MSHESAVNRHRGEMQVLIVGGICLGYFRPLVTLIVHSIPPRYLTRVGRGTLGWKDCVGIAWALHE